MRERLIATLRYKREAIGARQMVFMFALLRSVAERTPMPPAARYVPHGLPTEQPPAR